MKKEILFVILAVSLGVIYYFFGTQYSSLKNYPPRNSTIVAFGDSLVEGYGSTAGNDFVSVLSKKLNKPIINLGISGNSTEDGLRRINEVILRKPGTVIVLFGGNDYLRNIPKSETFANLRQIISTLQADGSMVVLLGIQGGIFRDDYKTDFENLSKETGALYVPNVLLGLFGNSKYMSEVVHPNDLGYAKIADKVYDAIKDYVW
ncbi:MAG: GDSL-type esterase/lipase family protein [Nitrospira sp.]